MIGFYDVSEMRKSLIDFWEMRHLRFLGLNSQILCKNHEKLENICRISI